MQIYGETTSASEGEEEKEKEEKADVLLEREVTTELGDQERSSAEALKYIGGYIARKLGNKIRGLTSEPREGCSWIDLKDRGGLLTYPSANLVQSLEDYERIFKDFHGEEVNRGTDPIGVTVERILKRNTSWPKEVVQLFVKIRFFIELKF